MRSTVRGVLAVALAVLSTPAVASDFCQTNDPLRVYVVVVDSLHPDEVGANTPTLLALKKSGRWYDDAHAVLPTVTLANHAAMMTGISPEKNGIVTNSFFDGSVTRDMGDASLFLVENLVSRIERTHPCIDTATVLSWDPLYRLFQGTDPSAPVPQTEADFNWEPVPRDPSPSDSARDAVTLRAFVDWAASAGDHQFAFVNLTDVDNAGHVDASGAPLSAAGGPAAFRQVAIQQTDALLGTLVAFLRASGAWDSTVLLLASDHVMDWSLPDRIVNLAPSLGSYDVEIVQNGAAENVYVRSTGASTRETVVGEIAAIAAGLEGVERVITNWTTPSLADYGMAHERSGDLVLFAKPGYRFSDPSPFSNPIPGSHGHETTWQSTLLLAGGHASVGPACVVPAPARDPNAPPKERFRVPGNLSIAPTVASFFNLAGAFDGDPLAGCP